MKHIIVAAAAGLALAAVLPGASAAAQAGRTFVSSHGSDANNCSLTAPCRSFAAAFAVTNAGGEIDVLDTAGYGALTIDKAISIVNDGSIASVLVPSGGTGITINAGVNDAVSLRGLTIEGAGSGQNGIQLNTGAALTIENCVIRHVANDGILFYPNATSNLSVSNTLLADNGNNGINVYPSGAGTVTAVFNRVEANNNHNFGIIVNGANSTGTVKATASDSVAAGNAQVGFYAFTVAGKAPATFMLFHSVAANNNNMGLFAQGTGAILRAFQTMVTGNTNGWSTFNGGVVQSYGNNSIDGNTGNEGAPPSVGVK